MAVQESKYMQVCKYCLFLMLMAGEVNNCLYVFVLELIIHV